MAHDFDALAELAKVSDIHKIHVVQHFLYFPSPAKAQRAVADIVKRSFIVQQRLGADLVNWLVLAEHHIVPKLDAIAATRALFEEIAANHGGEYDGWEAEVPRRDDATQPDTD
jgi:hypothetical protein